MLYRNIVVDEQLLKHFLWCRMNVQIATVAVWNGNQLMELNQIYYNKEFKPVHGEYKDCLYLSSDYVHLQMMKNQLSDLDVCFVNTGVNDVLDVNMEHEISIKSIQEVQELLEETSFKKSL